MKVSAFLLAHFHHYDTEGTARHSRFRIVQVAIESALGSTDVELSLLAVFGEAAVALDHFGLGTAEQLTR